MGYGRWVASLFSAPFQSLARAPLVRPDRIEWNSSLSPLTVKVNNHALFYVEKGKGKPLILIHGYGAGVWIWERQIDLLAETFHVYALDLIGHGFSDRPRIGYRPVDYVHCLKEFMDALGIERATLIGNSMGGGVAWATALLFRDRVERIVLIDSVPPDVLQQVRNRSFRALALAEKFPLLPYIAIAGRNERSIREVLLECVADPKKITPGIVERQYRISNIRGTTWVLYATLKHAYEVLQLKTPLSKLSLPALLIWGEKDQIFPPAVGEELHRIIPGSILRVIRGSGHMPQWEAPDETNEIILSFLRKTNARP